MMIARRILDWGDTKDVVTLDNLRHAKHISRHLENRDVDPGDEIFEVKSR